MSELKNLSAILEGGAVPAGYNGKAIGKLSKTYLKLENRKVVNLYPIRTVMHDTTFDGCIGHELQAAYASDRQ